MVVAAPMEMPCTTIFVLRDAMLSAKLIGGLGPLQHVEPVFPAHLYMVPFAHPVSVKVGQQDVEPHLLAVQIAYHQHAHGIIRISVYDDCCFEGGVGGGNVECMQRLSAVVLDVEVLQCSCGHQAIHPGVQFGIALVHEIVGCGYVAAA